MAGIRFDENEVRKAISILKPEGQLFEIRAIAGKWNASGYFTDADTLIGELRRARIRGDANIYITLNAINRGCYSRAQRDVLTEYAKETTSDSNIDGYKWIMVDLDPIRASGTSSSDEELMAARKKANEIYTFLRDKGWNEPLTAFSGNGVHLLYRVQIRNTPENTDKMKKVLEVLSMLFTDDVIEVDRKTFNPSRICKLYGTMAAKGADTEERPHRMSRINSAPAEIKVNDISLINDLIGMLPEPEKPDRVNNYDPKAFNLQDWIDGHGIKVREKSSWSGGTKWVLECCPFDENHKGKDAAIVQTNDGKIGFNCFHNSCADRHWKELRELYEPDAYEHKRVEENIKPNHTSVKKKPELPEYKSENPVFFTTEQIRALEAPPEEFIKSGIRDIDHRLRGLKKGFVSVLSGLRACGKSSVISQLSVEAASSGYRTALFSGELTAKNTFRWLILQCAGKANVEETQFDGYYVPKAGVEETVSKQLDGKVYIYNNEYGNNFDFIKEQLAKCVEEHKVDLIILDNLMALNISSMAYDKYQQQSAFVEYLENFAKQTNTHILFVAHPRKSQGFLRLDDISGSNDIVNRVDNAFILHRVNKDFRRMSKDMFGWKDDDPLYKCSNVIEICKDRDGGNQDVFIPLYFERETKRLKNSPGENKIYFEDVRSDDKPPF